MFYFLYFLLGCIWEESQGDTVGELLVLQIDHDLDAGALGYLRDHQYFPLFLGLRINAMSFDTCCNFWWFKSGSVQVLLLFRYFQTLDGATWVGLVWGALMNLRMQTLKNFFLSFKDTHITVNFFVSCILWCLYSIFVLVNLWSLLMKVCMQLRSAHYNALTRPDGPNLVRILERLPKSKPQLEWQPGNREVKFQI